MSNCGGGIEVDARPEDGQYPEDGRYHSMPEVYAAHPWLIPWQRVAGFEELLAEVMAIRHTNMWRNFLRRGTRKQDNNCR